MNLERRISDLENKAGQTLIIWRDQRDTEADVATKIDHAKAGPKVDVIVIGWQGASRGDGT